VIYTPGHSSDHICLYESNQGWLFSGDLFVGGKDRALGAGYNIWQIIESLKKVSRLSIKTLFPGSARVRNDPAEEIQAKIEYYTELGEIVYRLHESGWSTSAIIREVCGGAMLIERVTLGHFSRRHLVNSYLAKYK
jgi:glyoxylase-like metal-dependent hydrolase (beta-lactamase superfamily II)